MSRFAQLEPFEEKSAGYTNENVQAGDSHDLGERVYRTRTELTTSLYNVFRSLELQHMISRYRLLNTKPSPLTYLQRPKVLSKTKED